MNQAINTGSHISTEILNYHKDGSTYWASIAISPIKNESNEIEGFIAVERDVTDKHYELACLQHEIAAIYHALVKQEQKTNAHDLRPRPTA
jgi:signal transduction histidine kinase